MSAILTKGPTVVTIGSDGRVTTLTESRRVHHTFPEFKLFRGEDGKDVEYLVWDVAEFRALLRQRGYSEVSLDAAE